MSDLRRDDRQNVAAVVRRSSNAVREHLRALQTDATRPKDTQGTEAIYTSDNFSFFPSRGTGWKRVSLA